VTPEVTGASLNLSAASGKLALVSNTTQLEGSCPIAGGFVVDFVGYGSADCSEGSAAATLSNTTALHRAADGCSDTDQNSADFATAPPSPVNGGASAVACVCE